MKENTHIEGMEEPTNIAEAIKLHRKRLGYTFKELEIKSGVSAAYILRLEKSDKKNPTIKVLILLSTALGVDMFDYVKAQKDKV